MMVMRVRCLRTTEVSDGRRAPTLPIPAIQPMPLSRAMPPIQPTPLPVPTARIRRIPRILQLRTMKSLSAVRTTNRRGVCGSSLNAGGSPADVTFVHLRGRIWAWMLFMRRNRDQWCRRYHVCRLRLRSLQHRGGDRGCLSVQCYLARTYQCT